MHQAIQECPTPAIPAELQQPHWQTHVDYVLERSHDEEVCRRPLTAHTGLLAVSDQVLGCIPAAVILLVGIMAGCAVAIAAHL
jgi:hypothetical protein